MSVKDGILFMLIGFILSFIGIITYNDSLTYVGLVVCTIGEAIIFIIVLIAIVRTYEHKIRAEIHTKEN